MTPQEERNKRFDEKFPCSYVCCGGDFCDSEEHKVQLEEIKSFLQSEIDLAISDYQTNFEQKHIASAVEVALLVQKNKISEMIKTDLIDSIMNKATAKFIDQEINWLEKEIDENDDGMWTGREFADKWLAHLTSLKELIK